MFLSYIVLSGLAVIAVSIVVQQIAYTIVNGSVFDPIRNSLRRGIRNEVRGAETMHALFTCTLCMTTQVSIWLIGLPTTITVFVKLSAVETLLWRVFDAGALGVSATFLIAGIATWFMTRSEYPSVRYHALRVEHEKALEKIEVLTAQMNSSAAFAEVKPNNPDFPMEALSTLIAQSFGGYQGIWCPVRRERCYREASEAFVTEWFRTHNTDPLTRVATQQKLRSIIRQYAIWGDSYDESKRGAFLEHLYKEAFG